MTDIEKCIIPACDYKYLDQRRILRIALQIAGGGNMEKAMELTAIAVNQIIEKSKCS